MKQKIESMIPRLRSAASGPKREGREAGFYAAFLLLAATVGFAFSLGRNARQLMGGFLEREIRDFKFVVFLDDHADRSFLEEHFLSSPGIRSVRFVTREEALGRAQDDPALAESLKLTVRNPLPQSFDVVWDPSFLSLALLGPAAEKWADLDGVVRVAYDRSRLERAELLSRVRDESDLIFFVVLWGLLATAVLGVGRLLFNRATPLRLGLPLGGVVVGAAGGAIGSVVVLAWIGKWEAVGILAGSVVGLLGGLFHGGREKG